MSEYVKVKDFLSKPAPIGYVAGLGRGATGFTTRSDIGPARESAGRGEGLEDRKRKRDGDDEGGADAGGGAADEERYENNDPDNETGLFAGGTYEADDEEADRIWEMVDRKMDERRKARREAREKEELEKMRAEKPKIQQQFADIKRSLADLTEDEWAAIPEASDLSRRKGVQKTNQKERFTPVPDAVLLRAQGQNDYETSLDARQQGLGGIATPAPDGTLTDFVQFGQARGQVLGLKLDQVSDSVSGKTTVDPKGYLTDLSSIQIKSDADISDYKKARTLLKSVITTNPKHAPGWIAAARLEEIMGKLIGAREIIAKGCEECPKSEDVWLEAARLNTPENAKIILANAVRHLPQSVRIWLKAMDFEHDVKSKKRVIRRALEFIPNSVSLWKSAVSLEEDPEDARILLSRAVECVPISVDLWLALARLETYDSAKKVLNRGRAAIPTSHEIWIAAARLEEQQQNMKMVDTIISRAVTALSQKGTVLDRDQWLAEAERSEKEGYPVTCQAIVRATIGLDIEDADQRRTWMDDAERFLASNAVETARTIYAHTLKTYPNRKEVWQKAAFLEKQHGTRESLEELLQRAVGYCPQAEVLWLMAAKEKWLGGDVAGARVILAEAFRANPDSEDIWLAAVKLESENGEVERARTLLTRAREQASTRRVWMKSAVFERTQKRYEAALELLDSAIEKYPDFDKLWMIKGQIESDDLGDLNRGRETYARAVKACPKSIPLWILASRLEEKAGLLIRGRALLERARLLNPKVPELWLEAVKLEVRGNNAAMAKALLAKALQECPSAGALWAEAILMEPRPLRKSKSADALKKCENDAHVVCVIARLFWAERKVDKARNWFQRTTKTDPHWGDGWAWWYTFELQHGTSEQQKDVIDQCTAAEPKYGEVWAPTAKATANVGKTKQQILLLVAAQLSNTSL
ncbi:PRP1 splicing factor, N-terminal-domain-containing protein [Hyaloraphidium curvatum]|nr:PRP1 splicing factor, N-terminal-domain-containing protein [Hyaloraphidium curvatum]